MDSARRHKEIQNNFELLQQVVKIREPRVAHIYHCDWLAATLGVKFGPIITSTKRYNAWSAFARWHIELPLRLGHVVTGHFTMRDCWPTLPRLGLRPQNIIPPDSDVIRACETGNIKWIQDLLSAKAVHPNDKTPDNLTVFRYAVRSGNTAIVQLLLDHGADPNLTFGEFETSPLNNAFLIGNVEIIRLLLNAKAELAYMNLRAWTSVSYLWEPERPALDHTNEIIQICNLRCFEAWNDADHEGMTPCHRAAAYGRGEDIRALAYTGADLHMYTTAYLWGPITAAVWYGNKSTFDVFMDLLPVEELLSARDQRGWTLLHMAAQNGREHMMKRLLDIGVDINALKIGTSNWLYDSLKWKSLTAEMLAREYGHGELWDKLVVKC